MTDSASLTTTTTTTTTTAAASLTEPPADFVWPTDATGYELVSKIGQGAFATVYLGQTKPNNDNNNDDDDNNNNSNNNKATCAVKILNLDHVDSDLAEIRREVQAMRLSSHPNVLTCCTAFCYDIHLWLVTPLMRKGSSLHCLQTVRQVYLQRQGQERGQAVVPPLEPHILYIVREALLGLQYLHQNGQIHRDVKGGNLLLDANGDVKVADFGVSGWLVQAGTQQEKAKTFVGTPCWMAPEVMEQVNGYDFKADIWSLGITALELAKGYAPYARYPPMKVLILTIQEDPPSLDTYDQLEMGEQSDDELEAEETFSRAFSSFIESCLQKNPSRRPTCDALLSSKILNPLNDEATHAQRRALLKQQVCDVCPDVGSNNSSQSQQQQPGHVPISILLNTAKDRQPGTSWVFPDGSQVFASSVTNAASSDEVMAQLEEFAAQTGGEHYQRGEGGIPMTDSGDTIKASSSRASNPLQATGLSQHKEKEEDEDDLDDFMDQFEQETAGENFQRGPGS